jgi:uncharacterized Zn finger protein (UPF0148 family)
MVELRSVHCPNCSAPLEVPLGATEALCEYCESHLRWVPDDDEMEVVRTREEMKYRERVAVRKAEMRQQMEQEEMERWRQLAGRVAIQAVPVLGDAAGKAVFRAAIARGGGCLGCGCVVALGVVGSLLALLLGLVGGG